MRYNQTGCQKMVCAVEFAREHLGWVDAVATLLVKDRGEFVIAASEPCRMRFNFGPGRIEADIESRISLVAEATGCNPIVRFALSEGGECFAETPLKANFIVACEDTVFVDPN